MSHFDTSSQHKSNKVDDTAEELERIAVCAASIRAETTKKLQRLIDEEYDRSRAGVVSPTAALRDNADKPELYFIYQFPTALEAFCWVKSMGAIKYDRDNWRKGGKPYHEYISACGRHLLAYAMFMLKMPGSSYYAPDTGCAHLAHAVWNLMALMDLNHPGMTRDPELYAKMAEHWQQERLRKANDGQET